MDCTVETGGYRCVKRWKCPIHESDSAAGGDSRVSTVHGWRLTGISSMLFLTVDEYTLSQKTSPFVVFFNSLYVNENFRQSKRENTDSRHLQ